MDNKEKQIVYMVLLDYSTDDCNGVDVNLYNCYEKALKRFLELIELEKKPETSWVSNAFDENNNLVEWYELDTNIENIEDQQEHELWWNVIDKFNYNYHTFIDLRIKEIE